MAEIAGLKLIVPSSVAGSGVSVSASGKVTFTAATSVSVNGCFDSTYDNYLVVMRMKPASLNPNVQARLRLAGTDATASDYTRQYLVAGGTSVSGARSTQGYATVGFASGGEGGSHLYLYGPSLAQPTAFRSVCVAAFAGAYIQDDACTHSLSTAYDGITLYPSSDNITGALTIYGLSQ